MPEPIQRRTVIVCGMPRSGTRMVAKVLNTAPNVYISAEFPGGLTSRLFDMIGQMDMFFGQRDYKDDERWKIYREGMVHDVWLANSLCTRDKSRLSVIGNKTPANEDFFDKYERCFLVNRPTWVYCLRSPFKVLRSLKNMPWNKFSVEENWERWKRSYSIFERMEAEAPGRIMRVSFDDESLGGTIAIGRRLLESIDVPVSARIEEKWVAEPPAQPMASIIGSRTPEALTWFEKRMIRKDPLFRDAARRFSFLDMP